MSANSEAIIAEIEQRLAEGWTASAFYADKCRVILADMKELAARRAEDAETERILAMPEDEVRAAFVAEGKDPDAIAARMRQRLNTLLAAHHSTRASDQLERSSGPGTNRQASNADR